MNYFKHSLWENVNEFIKNIATEQIDEPTSYALKVYQNKIVASEMVRLQAARHLLFLYHQSTDPDFGFIYDASAYQKVADFAKHIIIPETKKPFIFTDFRAFITGFVFGWRYRNDPSRNITTEVFDIEARKQWKSSFWAMIALATSLGLLKDGAAEVYFCGPHKESSKIPYKIALGYIKTSKKIKKLFERANSVRIISKKMGEIKALPFDKAGLEGKNPSLVILTEYHLHKDETMQESAMTSKNLSRKNQLIVYDTTKGANIESVCFHRERDYKNFLISQILNPESIHPNFSVFLFCAELDEADWENWKDSKLWKKSNPGLGVTVSLQDLEAEASKITNISAEAEFKIKRLGIWVNTGMAYFSFSDIMESQKANKAKVEEYLQHHNLKELNALMGIDLSSTSDTTAICLNWEIPQADGESIYLFKIHSFIPSDSIAKKEISDKARYRQWLQQGLLTASQGKVIDYSLVVDKIREWKNLYNIKKLLYDRWRFFAVKDNILKNEVFSDEQVQDVKQGVYLNPAFQQFEIKLRNKKIYILDDNELVFSHILNVEVQHSKNSTETFLIKKLSTNSRIDAFIAMLNTISWRHNITDKTTEAFFDLIS
ncbi:phage terminase large subunit-like protein [Mycoplasmopsis mustelae]|uniref:Phage terminase large subunit-like protein n=1 Tax=Mycoplasmopsis mustelae TaxID=171289 RepID=A0A4R7UC91_9BACT|nr:terminase TerL endonuclease subunit [Mycoplasmopsis mustelae]TDV23498.1 phage terminase large subunit-like protein [Mycoplasmopsis mustelae]